MSRNVKVSKLALIMHFSGSALPNVFSDARSIESDEEELQWDFSESYSVAIMIMTIRVGRKNMLGMAARSRYALVAARQ